MNGHKRLHILVVDDEPLIRWSVAETLGAAGHQVVEAGDCATALRAVSDTARPFDVVLLDFRLPDSCDLHVLKRIRGLAPGTAVVLMTTVGTADIASRALALGAVRVMTKPFEMPDLESLVLEANRLQVH